jgi:hypothetical protein
MKLLSKKFSRKTKIAAISKILPPKAGAFGDARTEIFGHENHRHNLIRDPCKNKPINR